MTKKGTALWVTAVLLSAVLAAVRVFVTPRLVTGETGVGFGPVVLILGAVILVGLLLAGGVKRVSARELSGGRLTMVTVGALLTGCTLLLSSVLTLADFMMNKTMPYPINQQITDRDESLLYLLVITGLLAGGFFLFLAFRWFPSGRTVRGVLRLTALAPVLWCWIRVFRYELSYISSLSVYRHVFDLLLILFEMLFFLVFARYVASEEEQLPPMTVGVSLCTGVLAVAACVTRVAMLLAGNKEAFDACGLLTAADLGVAVLSLSFAFGQLTARESMARRIRAAVARQTELPEPALSREPLPTPDPAESEHARPLDVEDILSEIMQRLEDGEI